MPTLVEQVRPLADRFWVLPPELTVAEWCEQNLQLITIPTPKPGPYSTTLTPYVREPLECFRDPTVREFVMCWGSQTGKTTTMMVGDAWTICNDPGPFMWVFPGAHNAKDFATGRWLKLVYDNECLWSLLPKDKRKVKQEMQPFRGAPMHLVGSNSPANLASNPVRNLRLDEVDKLAEQSQKEADAVQLAEQRTKSYWPIRKIGKTSTPTVPGAPIWVAYLAGDQRRFFLHCPHCDGELLPVLSKALTTLPLVGCEAELVWDEQARTKDGWDYEQVIGTTRLKCPHCEALIENHEKTKLLRGGEWKPTATPTASWRRSYHLSSLYSPDIPWGELVVQFLQAKESLDGLQGFVNGALAEPWEHQDDRAERREAVVGKDVEPLSGKTIRILTADYQQVPPSWFVARDWIPGGHSRLVEWGTWEDFEDLEEHRSRLGVAPDLVGVDSGYDLPEVHRQCSRFGWFAMRGDDAAGWEYIRKGTDRKATWLFKIKEWDAYRGTADAGRRRKVPELTWSNPSIKDILAEIRKADRSHVRWEIPEDYATEEYFRHLDGERRARMENKKTGRISYQWIRRGRRWPNHLFDCECEQLAVALYLGLLKTRPEPKPISTNDDE